MARPREQLMEVHTQVEVVVAHILAEEVAHIQLAQRNGCSQIDRLRTIDRAVIVDPRHDVDRIGNAVIPVGRCGPVIRPGGCLIPSRCSLRLNTADQQTRQCNTHDVLLHDRSSHSSELFTHQLL